MRNPFRVSWQYHLRRRFDRRIIVIESDDWGMEMALDEGGVNWLRSRYGEDRLTRYSTDALETRDDLELLYDVLSRNRGRFGRPPVITANFVTHNFDYRSPGSLRLISLLDGFNPQSQDVRPLYSEGVRQGLIVPQLHGHNHRNLAAVETYLQTPEGEEAFAARFLAGASTLRGNEWLLRGELADSNTRIPQLLSESQEVLQQLFGHWSVSIIPPAFVLDSGVLGALSENGISVLQASNRLIQSHRGRRPVAPLFRDWGGFLHFPRNARLDPHPDYGFGAERCLADIARAFSSRVPAVIDFHRVNFSGRYDPAYRDRTLRELTLLLDGISRRWPDAEFLSTAELAAVCRS